MKKEHTVNISMDKMQRAELALMHIGANLIKAGELMKEKYPAAYSLMEADADGLADALEIIRGLMPDNIPEKKIITRGGTVAGGAHTHADAIIEASSFRCCDPYRFTPPGKFNPCPPYLTTVF